MSEANKQSLTTSQIGRCGEMLVQYLLLFRGIESAPMTTDAGVDLVAYSSGSATPKTIQVKTNLRPKLGGGKGSRALDWWIGEHTPAQLVALVDLSSQRVWVFTFAEIEKYSQQKSNGRYHLYMYLEPPRRIRKVGCRMHTGEFEHFLLSKRVDRLFNLRAAPKSRVQPTANGAISSATRLEPGVGGG